ncbi:hypothetical protein C1O63_0034 [Dehalococcoides mccartyi]|nr:hypothetical protein C1O63_0034 [Dehalococcoides mccartyi]
MQRLVLVSSPKSLPLLKLIRYSALIGQVLSCRNTGSATPEIILNYSSASGLDYID